MLSQESLQQIDREIAKYPSDQKQSAVMAALRIAQVEKGWLPKELIEFVARYRVGGRAVRLHERSRFVREAGRWYYVDGDIR